MLRNMHMPMAAHPPIGLHHPSSRRYSRAKRHQPASTTSLPFDLDFQSQIRSIKRHVEFVEDIPPQYDVGNLGGDNFDAMDKYLMESEVNPIGAGSDGDVHPVRQCNLTIFEQR